MKDKHGFEVRVGDVLRYGNGDMKIVKSLYEAGEHGCAGFRSLDGGGCDTEHHWIILRRADGSVPTKCDCDGRYGVTCSHCHGTGSIDRKPEAKEGTSPVDKHGREMRSGDLCSWDSEKEPRRIVSEPRWDGVRNWHFDVKTHPSDPMRGKAWPNTSHSRDDMWEVLSRGLPTDPVPESFEPERDAERRPVLGEPTRANKVVTGDYVRAVREGIHLMVGRMEVLCGGPIGLHTQVHRRKEMVTCKACLAAIASVATATIVVGEDPHSRYLAFDKRVREIVAEEAPEAKVVTDTHHHTLGDEHVAWIRIGDAEHEFVGGSEMEARLRACMHGWLRELGARELGKR